MIRYIRKFFNPRRWKAEAVPGLGIFIGFGEGGFIFLIPFTRIVFNYIPKKVKLL